MFHICYFLTLLCLSIDIATGYRAYPSRTGALDSNTLNGLDLEEELLLKRLLEVPDEEVDEQFKRNEKKPGSQECPDGWLANDGSCYFFGLEEVNFVEADTYCQQLGGNLVNVEDEHESAFLKQFMTTTTKGSSYWLGMTDVVEEGTWVWSGQEGDKSVVKYFDWGPNEPNDGREDCAWIEQIKGYRWSDVHCTRKTKPVCEKKALKSCRCATGWVEFGSTCYYFGHDLVTFTEANRKCQQRQGQLVQVESEAEWAFLKSQAEEISLEDFWIGLTDTFKEGEWMWINTWVPASFTKWTTGEPNNVGTVGEHCAHMSWKIGYMWNDLPCDLVRSFVCEA